MYEMIDGKRKAVDVPRRGRDVGVGQQHETH